MTSCHPQRYVGEAVTFSLYSPALTIVDSLSLPRIPSTSSNLGVFGALNARRAEVTSLAARYRLPAIYPFRVFAQLGGLLCYGNDLLDSFRRAADYADHILKGAKPSELPVQFPVKFELVINMKTAKTLGLDVPLHRQQRADEVIE